MKAACLLYPCCSAIPMLLQSLRGNGFRCFSMCLFHLLCLKRNQCTLQDRSKSIQISSLLVEEFVRHHMTKSKGFSLVMHVSYPEQGTTIFESAPLSGLGFTTCQEMSSHSIPCSLPLGSRPRNPICYPMAHGCLVHGAIQLRKDFVFFGLFQ